MYMDVYVQLARCVSKITFRNSLLIIDTQQLLQFRGHFKTSLNVKLSAQLLVDMMNSLKLTRKQKVADLSRYLGTLLNGTSCAHCVGGGLTPCFGSIYLPGLSNPPPTHTHTYFLGNPTCTGTFVRELVLLYNVKNYLQTNISVC